MNDIVGHDKIQDFFIAVIDNGGLSHAYCFVGQTSVGKNSVAEWVSGKLLETEKLSSQPDFNVIEPVFDEKTEKTKKDITIAQIRELKNFLSRRAFAGGYKIAIIKDADKMNSEAANGLLKTLEEPSKKTVLFLLTTDESQLPATIQSRCQMIYFYPVEKNLIQNYLQSLGVKNAEEIARLSFGRPGKAISWIQDSEVYSKYKQEILRFETLFGKSFHDKIKAVEELFGDKTDHIKARNNLIDILNIWEILIRDSFLKKYQIHHVVSIIKEKEFVGLYEEIENAKKMLLQNIHPRLIVENILLQLP